MGIVYLAEDLRLPGKNWAIKQTGPHDPEEGDLVAEAEVLIRLDHEHLPKIADWFTEDDGIGYLVMEVVDGEPLSAKFRKSGCRFPFDDIVEYARQICETLAYLHQLRPRPIIYRDLKPANLMLDKANRIRLIDFGIARSYKLDQQADTLQIGTIGFASPEQFLNRQTDPRSDLYSLGAILYYWLTGGTYYYAARTMLKPSAQVPDEMCRLVGRLLQDQPERRCQTAEEVLAWLGRIRNARTATGNPDRLQIPWELPGPSRHSLLLAVGSLYPGAGSTFAIESLAYTLSAMGVAAAVVEYTGKPMLYGKLQGDLQLPKGCRFWDDPPGKADGLGGPAPPPWQDQRVSWYPANPQRAGHEEDKLLSLLAMLRSLQQPVVIVDISHRLDHPEVLEVMRLADTAVIVAGADLGQLLHGKVLRAAEVLVRMEEAGKRVIRVGNRMVPGAVQWLKPVLGDLEVSLPAVDPAAVHACAWRGKSFMRHPTVGAELKRVWQTYLRKAYPWIAEAANERGRLRRLLRRFKADGGTVTG